MSQGHRGEGVDVTGTQTLQCHRKRLVGSFSESSQELPIRHVDPAASCTSEMEMRVE